MSLVHLSCMLIWYSPLVSIIFVRAWIKHHRVCSMCKRKGEVLPERQKPKDSNRNVCTYGSKRTINLRLWLGKP